MPLFVYGTLMDPDMLGAVLGRDPAAGWAGAAHLPGHDIVAVAGRPYPMLIRRTGARAAGHLIAGLDARDMAHLRRYEGRSYHLRRVRVRRPGGALVAARLFACREKAGRHGWHLEHWQKRHKSAALRQLSRPARAVGN